MRATRIRPVLLAAVASLAAALLLPAATPAAGASAGSGWQTLTNPPPFDPGVMLLLTDGRVLVQDQGTAESGTGNFWLLTPDAQGSYADGTWSQAASLPAGYAPLYAADAVLPDGRVILMGGEFNGGAETWTNQGAIYDPAANTWTPVAPPNGGVGNWSRIGDAPSVVLANGSFMLGASGYSGTADEAILDASNLTWTATGAGKADGNGEEGFTLLPSGEVLTVDAKSDSCLGQSEIYDPVSGTWMSAGLTPSPLVDCNDDVSSGEIGPQLLMYDGKVFVEGATGTSALYDTGSGTWSAGPDLPTIGGTQYVAADAASALLPDGNVLLELSPGTGVAPTHFFLFDGTSLTQVADSEDAANEASNYGYMLMLPTGQVLFDGRVGPSSLELYGDGGTPNPAWAPEITSAPSQVVAGQSYTLSGQQLNGLSEGAAFGDDYQESTDYPLVQITDDASGTVTYARTSGMTNRSIAPGAASSTSFTVPACIPEGSSELRVIANGIASAPISVEVGLGADTSCARALLVSTSGSGRGTVTSSPAGISCGTACARSFTLGTVVALTATPAAGSSFTGWSGACSGTGTCQLTIAANASVAAAFKKPGCVVPKVTGKKLAAAKTALRKAHCTPGRVRRAFSRAQRGRVTAQKPRPGARLPVKARVNLTVSKGRKRRR